MIIEGIISSRNKEGKIHCSAMGPFVDVENFKLEFRPFQPSTTLNNLQTHPEGVFHIVDDACLIADLAIRCETIDVSYEPANRVDVEALTNCCRRFEFVVQHIDVQGQRATVQCEIVQIDELRPFIGFNRANHALIEASILATRISFLPSEFVTRELDRLSEIVGKTGKAEHGEAMQRIQQFVSASSK